MAFWELPGKETLRKFWPIFYRRIKFSGIIFMLDYQNKENLNESIKVLHDLLTEQELSNCSVMIVLNYEKKISNDNDEINTRRFENTDVYPNQDDENIL